MPRKNNRPRPPEQRTHQLDSFTMWAEKIIAENRRKPPQHSILTSKKRKEVKKNEQ